MRIYVLASEVWAKEASVASMTDADSPQAARIALAIGATGSGKKIFPI